MTVLVAAKRIDDKSCTVADCPIGVGSNGWLISIGGGSKVVDDCCPTMGNGLSGVFSPGMVSSRPVCAACCRCCAFDA